MYQLSPDQIPPCVLSYCRDEVILLFQGCFGPGLGPANIRFIKYFLSFVWQIYIKGIVHNFFLYRSNLIFWIVMGCGIADVVRRGL